MGLFNAHRDAVIDFAWNNSLAVSGDRAGILAFWDINRSEPLRVAKGHGSAVGKICFYSDDQVNNVILTAGLGDGRVNVYDMRSGQMVKAAVVHKGAINMLGVSARTGHLVTASADKTVKVFDMRGGEGKNLSRVKMRTASDSILCGELVDEGNLCLVGGADGNLTAYDLGQGGKTGSEHLYAFGRDTPGALSCMKVSPDQSTLVIGGETGQAHQLRFDN